MTRFATLSADADLAASILSAPAWAQLALSMRDEQMRQRGAEELARAIREGITEVTADSDQFALPI